MSLKMDSSSRIWLELKDLPPSLSVSDLPYYLTKTYPGKQVIIKGPHDLSTFGSLPSELLGKIIRTKTGLDSISVRINKPIRNYNLNEFYEKQCQIPVSKDEILRELDSGGKVTVFDTDEEETLWMHSYTKNEYGDINVGEVEYCGQDWQNSDFDVMIIHDSGDYVLGPEHIVTTLDLFSEWKLLEKRDSCMQYNPRYADEHLVKRYNREFGEDLEEPLEEDDVKKTFYANYIAVGLPNSNLFILDDRFDLKEKGQVAEILIPEYEDAKNLIKSETIKLTGARSLGNLLILPKY